MTIPATRTEQYVRDYSMWNGHATRWQAVAADLRLYAREHWTSDDEATLLAAQVADELADKYSRRAADVLREASKTADESLAATP
jgi:hypothetical protein